MKIGIKTTIVHKIVFLITSLIALFLFSIYGIGTTSATGGTTPGGCFSIKQQKYSAKVNYWSINGYDVSCGGTDVIIPETISGYTIEGIYDYAFYDEGITSVVIPDTVVTIGIQSFAENDITDVVLGNNVSIIGQGAFSGNSIISLFIPGTVSIVSDGAFQNNLLRTVILQDGVATIGIDAFKNNQIEYIYLPSSLSRIGEGSLDRNENIVVVVENAESLVYEGALSGIEVVDKKKDYFVFFDSSNNFLQLNSGEILLGLEDMPEFGDIILPNTGDIFIGWFLNKQGVGDDILYDFARPVTGDLVLYPHWIAAPEDSVVVSFVEDGNIIQIQNIVYGETATNIGYTKDRGTGYVWKGWYPSLGEGSFDFSSAIFENTYLYAVWGCDEHYHMSDGRCEIDTYTITWLDEDGTIIDTTSASYGSMPAHEGVIHDSDFQYSYEFSGWMPSISEVTGDVSYTAVYSHKLNEYTVTIQSNNIDYGMVSIDSVTVGYGSNISLDENILMVGDQQVVAMANESTDVYTYLFVGWTDDCGSKLKGNCMMTANFIPVKNQYLVQFINEDGTILQTGMYMYGDIPVYTGKEPQKESGENFEYRFDGWSPMISAVYTGEIYVAVFSDKMCLSGYHLEEGECINDVKNVLCEEIGAPSNATYDMYDVEILWTGDAWSEAESCTWTCNEQYRQNGNECELDSEYMFDDTGDSLNLDTNLQKDIGIDIGTTNELKKLDGLSENDDLVKGEIDADQDIQELEQRKLQGVSQIREAKNIKRGGGLMMSNSISLQSVDPSRVCDDTKGSINLTFNANGGGFPNGNSVEVVEYGYYNREETKYSHTSNYTDGNSTTTTYITTSDAKTETVTITGAETLLVNVIYDLGHSDGLFGIIGTWTDYLTIYRGNGTTSQIEQLQGDSAGTKNYTIVSDAVTFKMEVGSFLTRTAEEKGYYATILGIIPIGWRTQVSEIENPNREGYRFLGWTTDQAGENEFDFDSTEVTGAMTLYAQWEEAETVTVSFDSNGGTSVASQSVVSGSTAIEPKAPTKDTYSFGGRYLDTGLMTIFDFSTIITDDIILYAKWDDTFTVTFNTNGGNNISPQYIASGGVVIKPDSPILQGKIFNYWSTDSGGNNEYNFSTPVTSDITLYAQWANICTVSFRNGYCYYGNGNNRRALCTYDIATSSIQVACGQPVRRPVDPNSPITVQIYYANRSLYFAKWSTREQPGYGNTSYDYDFDTPVNSNITLYAIGSTNYYTIGFDANGGLLYGLSSLEFNENKIGQYGKVREPDDPIRTGYIFNWWSTRRNNGTEFDFNTQITEDITLYAQWIPIIYTIKYNANGGSGIMDDTNMSYDATGNLRANAFEKTNATFLGRNTKGNGAGIGYSGGQSVNNLTEVSGTVITLYAQWSCNSGYVQVGNSCEVASCTFLGQTINNGSSMVVYSGGSATCPNECIQGLVTCTSGVLGGDTTYTNLSCTTNGVSCSDVLYPLTSCPSHGICNTSCTSYTVSGNACVLGVTRYELDSCDEHYHQSGNLCRINTYTVTYHTSGGTRVAPNEIEYGAVFILPGTTMSGYQFSGWYTQGGIFIGSSGTSFLYDLEDDLVLYARWIANTGANYIVKHWLQNADDDLYTELIVDREILQGTTDTLTQAVPNHYTGFEISGFTQSIISWDGSTVVNIYYDREIYTITIDLNGGTGVSTITGKYGQTLTQPDIARSGYTLKKYVPDFPATMPLNGTSVKAIWTLTNGGVSIRIVPLTGDDFNFGSVVASNKVQMLTGYLGENSFQLEDTRGENSGYYVTLSISTLNSVNTQNSIARSNIQLRSHGVTTITGAQASEVGISPQLLSWTTMDNTVLYLIRPNIVVEDDPLIGIYGDNLEFKVLVPPYTYPDRYKAVITYTLYDNDE